MSAAGVRARRRASSSIARLNPLYRIAARWNAQKLSAKTLTRWAATVLTSHPVHKLGVARASSSRASRRSAMRRRSAATASNICSRSKRAEYQRVGSEEPAGVVGDDQCSAGWKGVEPAHLGAEPYLGDGPTCSDELGHRAGVPAGRVGFAHSHPPWHMIDARRYIAESGTNIRVP
jgi:hypothetical protein